MLILVLLLIIILIMILVAVFCTVSQGFPVRPVENIVRGGVVGCRVRKGRDILIMDCRGVYRRHIVVIVYGLSCHVVMIVLSFHCFEFVVAVVVAVNFFFIS